MKKVFLLLVVIIAFTATGCTKVGKNTVVRDFSNKLDKSSGYHFKGKLMVHNNDDVYNYDVDVSYKKGNYYKVILNNSSNNYKQIILKNEDGVYVLTPSLNKSFRFQSDWPYNNSQIYLLDAIDNDIQRDKKIQFKEDNNCYMLTTGVHYPNNSKLVKQKIYFSKKGRLKKVVVYDSDGIDIMSMEFGNIDYSPDFSKKEFSINSIISKKGKDNIKETSNLDDVIYPLFVPKGTKLVDEEKIKKSNGERVIMNYDGEKSFLLVEETTDVFKDFTIIPSSGEPYLLLDSLGVMTDNSLSWTSGGVDFYLVSDVMNKDEMIEVAQSISGIVSMK